MSKQREHPLPFGGKYDRIDPDPSWSQEECQLWLARQLALGGKHVNARSRSRAPQNPGASSQASKVNKSQPKKPKPAADKQSWDRNAPCCECGSTEHQLSSHPNPNTPEGYLRGCLPCNTKNHAFADCRKFSVNQKKPSLFHYYRKCREGLCPGEWHGDPREISDKDGNYSLQIMPLTPNFALLNLYEDAKNFKHPGRGGKYTLKIDPFWTSNSAWSNLGYFSNPRARVDGGVLEKWIADSKERHAAIREHIAGQHTQQSSSAPTTAQIHNFSSVSYPKLVTQPPPPPPPPHQPPPRSFLEGWLDNHIREHGSREAEPPHPRASRATSQTPSQSHRPNEPQPPYGPPPCSYEPLQRSHEPYQRLHDSSHQSHEVSRRLRSPGRVSHSRGNHGGYYRGHHRQRSGAPTPESECSSCGTFHGTQNCPR